jgi:quinol-cytochrome oxidoreductase complex cytochrome b subunit
MARPNFFAHLHPPTIPAREARFRYTFGLGGIATFLFFILAVTGVPLMFVYTPTATAAAATIRHITFVAPYGWLLRNLHYWAGQLLLVTATLHLLRVTLTGSYKPPRRFNWLLGLSLLLLCLLLDFTGYVLRWDADTHWALTIGLNLVRQTPLIGPWLYGLLLGGPLVGDATVVRFYTWHTLGLSAPALGLLAWHVFRLRRDGGISHQARESAKLPRITRHELLQREGIAMLAVLLLLLLLALLADAPLGPPADPLAGRASAAAPWFFLWVQALLRWLPPAMAGLLIPLLVVAALGLLPWLLDRSTTGTAVWFNREGRLAQLTVLLLMAAITILTLLEAARP